MTVLHVRAQGAVVRRLAEEIRVTKREVGARKEMVLNRIAVHEVEQLIIYGNVQVTTQAAALLLQHNADVVFLSLGGKFRYRLLSDRGDKFAKLRYAQLQLSGDEARSLAVAKAIARAKLANQRNLLQRWATQLGEPQATGFLVAAQSIEQQRVALVRANDADMLRGFEGRAGATYFDSIKKLLDPSWSFGGRAYHPPPDPFNALLSFGYALLLKDVMATIQIVGLDPYLGCFHALEYGRPSLVLDLMEEFRPLVVDEFIVRMVTGGKIQPSDFTLTGQADRPIIMTEKPMMTVIKAYEQRLDETVAHAPSNGQQRLRRCLELQARIYARVVMETRGEYEGLVG